MADQENMSVEEILAACRRMDGGEGAQAGSAPQSAAKPEAPAAPAAGGDAGPQKKPSEMSVAEMLAAARGEKAGGDKPAAAPKKAAKPTPAKPAAKAAPAAKDAGPKDTASILAAARKASKPGPITKAEAAAKGTPAAAPRVKPQAPPMPEKPAYARGPAPTPASQERRGFFKACAAVLVGSPLAIGFSSLVATHILWLLGTARYMFPNILIEPPMKFKVGFPGDYAPGQVETKYKAQFGVWVVRHEYDGQQQIYALESVCTHLGCTPNWLEGEQKFKCPCHGSGFYKDGINFEGPAPRPLERYAIRTADDGQLEVDKSRKFQQEMDQWSDPSSFVEV